MPIVAWLPYDSEHGLPPWILHLAAMTAHLVDGGDDGAFVGLPALIVIALRPLLAADVDAQLWISTVVCARLWITAIDLLAVHPPHAVRARMWLSAIEPYLACLHFRPSLRLPVADQDGNRGRSRRTDQEGERWRWGSSRGRRKGRRNRRRKGVHGGAPVAGEPIGSLCLAASLGRKT